MSVELTSLHSHVYDLGRIKVCKDEVRDASLQTVSELGLPSQKNTNVNLPETTVEPAIDSHREKSSAFLETVVELHPTSPTIRSHDMEDNEGPGKTDAIEVDGHDLNNEILTVRDNETAEPCENHIPSENKIEEFDYTSVAVNEESTNPTTDLGTHDSHKEQMLNTDVIDSGATCDMLHDMDGTIQTASINESEATNTYMDKDAAVNLDQREGVPSAEPKFADVDHEQAIDNEEKDKNGNEGEIETELGEKGYTLPEFAQDAAAELIPDADHEGLECQIQDENCNTTSKEQLDMEFPCTGLENMLEGRSMNEYEDPDHPEAHQLEVSGFDLHEGDVSYLFCYKFCIFFFTLL